MPSDISLKARACITAEYAKLCSVVGLHPLPLDIYVHEKNSNELTPSKTKRGNATPLYVETIIVLPVVDPSEVSDTPLMFPPASWNSLSSQIWPSWRTDLWHEFLHQIEDKILRVWKPGEDNPQSTKQSAEHLAERLNVTVEQILGVI